MDICKDCFNMYYCLCRKCTEGSECLHFSKECCLNKKNCEFYIGVKREKFPTYYIKLKKKNH